MSEFRSILVANRGEIAVRVMRTAKSLGLRTVAVYSEADADAPHVRIADDAARVGAPPVGESYLNVARILDAARQTGADAIHPGYGFLSENADFARACEEAGLVFIGPSAESIDLMGNKAAAKRRMIEAGVPCVPGYQAEDQSDDALLRAAADIGYPLMVKAAAGGGGRGMRLVRQAAELPDAIQSARSEAANAFGSDELILEKAIIRPRHVEVQIFADALGNAIHLGERDCSVQRRHQKVVEEAPCPVMTGELRARMGGAAVEAAKSINYRGAGTVEFLLDDSGEFYFLEMNTRLQVEHPVTEMITGLDLVALQIRVAEGKPLGLTQEDIRLEGHAIEARLYAEDPAQDFLPVTGQVKLWEPAVGEGVRVDSGIASGQQISPFYDPMIAKVIAWGENRETANSRLINALNATRLFGLTTNKAFLVDILERSTFRAGQATTAFIAEEFADDAIDHSQLSPADAAVAATLEFIAERERCLARTLGVSTELLNWGSGGQLHTHYRYSSGETTLDLMLFPIGPASYRISCNDAAIIVEVVDRNATHATLSVDGRRHTVAYLDSERGQMHLSLGSRSLSLRNDLAFADQEEEAGSGGRVTAPMHGVLLKLYVSAGEHVEAGARLAVLEAMKMQHELFAQVAGEVAAIHCKEGTQVSADELLIEITAAEEASPS